MNNLIKLYLIIISCFILSGCKNPQIPETSAHILNGDEVFYLVTRTNNINPYRYFEREDKRYLFPTKRWVEQDFTIAYKNFLKYLRQDKYLEEVADCEDYSEAAHLYAQRLNANTPREYEAALAFGVLNYIRDSDSIGHSINVFIVFENDKFNILFYESQEMRIIELSDWEKYNCLSIRF